ncbi:MAG: hypothetical protein NPINA01_22120 [Nitrospinaceae bacterium]|nr:MAG: hypothetical protein NPINA01_22120 [Nitrospinaceae bacterium]
MNKLPAYGRQVLFILLVGFLFTGEASKAEADRGKKKIQEVSSKKKARVEGFRSARFGMTEKEVFRAIYKDFRISKRNVERQVHPLEKTVNLGISGRDLLPQTGPAKAYYVFGYKSRRLIQINIIWGKPVMAKPNAQEVVNLANQLRDHFSGKNFKQEGLVLNAPLGPEAIMVFRGSDETGRMVLLILDNPKNPVGPPNQDIVLKLSYIQRPGKADVFQVKKEK